MAQISKGTKGHLMKSLSQETLPSSAAIQSPSPEATRVTHYLNSLPGIFHAYT